MKVLDCIRIHVDELRVYVAQYLNQYWDDQLLKLGKPNLFIDRRTVFNINQIFLFQKDGGTYVLLDSDNEPAKIIFDLVSENVSYKDLGEIVSKLIYPQSELIVDLMNISSSKISKSDDEVILDDICAVCGRSPNFTFKDFPGLKPCGICGVPGNENVEHITRHQFNAALTLIFDRIDSDEQKKLDDDFHLISIVEPDSGVIEECRVCHEKMVPTIRTIRTELIELSVVFCSYCNINIRLTTSEDSYFYVNMDDRCITKPASILRLPGKPCIPSLSERVMAVISVMMIDEHRDTIIERKAPEIQDHLIWLKSVAGDLLVESEIDAQRGFNKLTENEKILLSVWPLGDGDSENGIMDTMMIEKLENLSRLPTHMIRLRLQAMVLNGLCVKHDGKIQLTEQGIGLAKFIQKKLSYDRE